MKKLKPEQHLRRHIENQYVANYLSLLQLNRFLSTPPVL